MRPSSLLSICIVATSFLFSCTRSGPYLEKEDDVPEQDGPFQSGIAVVKFTEPPADPASPVRSSLPEDLVGTFGITAMERVFSDDERFLERQRREGLHLWYYITFDPEAPVTRAAERLASRPDIEFASPVRRIRPTAHFNDPFCPQQWYLENSSGVDLNIVPVWKSYTTGEPKVIVAVLDGGIDAAHEDLQANVLPGGFGKSRNFVSGGYTLTPNGHGTHVGGIIGATGNNGIGTAGIAGGDVRNQKAGVTLLSCQVFEEKNGETQSGNFADAFRYAADNGAVIAQNSWGYVFDLNNDGNIDAQELERAKESTIDAATKAAVDYFIKYAGCDNDGHQLPDAPMKGGIVIFAAGNDNIPYGAPANYEKVIAVAAVKKDGTKAAFSNYGDWVDICAPGDDILSTYFSSDRSDKYTYLSGTSMAAPMVSGIAALVLSCRGGQGFTNDMLWDCLLRGADTEKVKSRNIGPFSDALGAVLYGHDVVPGEIRQFETTVRSNNITVEWTVPADKEGVPAYGTLICAAKDPTSLEQLDPAHIPETVRTETVLTYDRSVGEKADGILSGMEFGQDYFITVIPFSYNRIFAPAAPVAKVTTGQNNPPVIAADGPTQGLQFSGTTSTHITIRVHDPDGHSFKVEYRQGSAGETWFSYSPASHVLTINGTKVPAGHYTAVVSATDAFGAQSSLSIDYEILENRPPEVKTPIANVLMRPDDGTRRLDLNDHFSDPDGDILNYTLTNSNPSIHAVASNGILSVTPRENGLAEISVTAKDPRNHAATLTFRTAVRPASEQVSVYPTQVRDILYIGTGETESPVTIRIISQQNGTVVLETTCSASVFYPAEMSLSGLAPGRYHVSVFFDGQTYSKNIVKR